MITINALTGELSVALTEDELKQRRADMERPARDDLRLRRALEIRPARRPGAPRRLHAPGRSGRTPHLHGPLTPRGRAMLDPTAKDQRLLRRLRAAGEGPLTDADRTRARALRDTIDAALAADTALRADAVPDDLSHLPPHRDWTWRPALWRAPVRPLAWAAPTGETPLSPDTTLFHDCPLGEIAARQTRGDAAPFALALDVYAFRGSYLSLAVTLPDPGARQPPPPPRDPRGRAPPRRTPGDGLRPPEHPAGQHARHRRPRTPAREIGPSSTSTSPPCGSTSPGPKASGSTSSSTPPPPTASCSRT